MNPIQLNEQQIEALNNGATKFWFPLSNLALDQYSNSDDLGHDFTWENPEHIGHWVSGVEVFSPLQPNEQYFVQEQTECPGDCNMGQACQLCGSNGQFIGTVDYMPNSCSIKFTATDVEVKHVQDIVYWSELGLFPVKQYPHPESGIKVSEYRPNYWHDSQYPDQPYSQNPVGFLISIKRIS